MQRRRSHETVCGGGHDFWDVISTLTQDLTKARNQLARLMKQVKPRLYGGADRRPPLQPIYTPPCARAGSNLPPNCHRSPPPGHFMCGKQYPHYKSPSPERPRPVTSFQSYQSRPRERAPPPVCRPRKRAPWSFEQPLPQPERAPYSCYERPEPVGVPEEECESDCIRICFNPRPRPRRCCCSCGSGPARLQGGGGGRGKRCLGTQFASLLQDVTCQLRERRLNPTLVDAELSNRTSCS